MTLQPLVTEDDLDAFSANFLSTGDLISRFGPEGIIPADGNWWESDLGDGLATRVVAKPDGTVWFQATLDQVLRVQVRSDTQDGLGWNSVEARFNDAGDMTVKRILMDSGLQREDFYEEGARVAIRYTDLDNDHSWDDVTNFYDATGVRVGKLTNYEDGLQREDVFENGLRVQTTLNDPEARNDGDWLKVVTDFDASGERVMRETTFADGAIRKESFENGVRTSLTVIDSTEGGSAAWQEISADYDMLGQLAQKTTIYDSGETRIETLQAGQRVEILQTDDLNIYEWSSLERFFDETGQVGQAQTTFDTGDITLMFYEDGVRQSRIEFDGDGTEDWLYRLTSYDENGVAAVETYVDGTSVEIPFLDPGEIVPPAIGEDGPPPGVGGEDEPDLNSLLEVDILV